MSNPKGISVIICCHNSSERISTTLQYLANQIQIPGFVYEIILVDNNCTDNTVQTAINSWNLLSSPFSFHIVQEKQAGLTYARQKGITEAHFDYLIFCDDDNWLCSDYLKKTINIFEMLPDVSLIGGIGEPVFESRPPAWFYRVRGFGYAVGNEGRTAGYVDSIYGAGMGLRKKVFVKLMGNDTSFILSDRKGSSLSSGGDVEICLKFNKARYKIYMDNDLCFKHFITTNRLKWSYYLQLRKEFGVANAYLQAYIQGSALTDPSNFVFYAQRAISYFIFLCRRVHFFLFPQLFKNASCAGFVQILSMKKTLLNEGTTIRAFAKKINLPGLVA